MHVEHWETVGDELVRTFQFASFADAMEFMAQMATVSDEMNHHPTWTNTYNRVEVRLTTHDQNGLSDLDHNWAEAANRLTDMG